MTLRPTSLSYFGQSTQSMGSVRGQNFTVHRLAAAPATPCSLCGSDELLFIFPDTGGTLLVAGVTHRIPPRALVITPPGTVEVSVDGPGYAYALATGNITPSPELAVNAACYERPDPRVRPLDPAVSGMLQRHREVRIYPIDQIPFPPGNPRLKLLRTATMSINWVDYDGARDRTKLSPHAHTDFEQGSLAIHGDFVHHIRAPWTPDATQWQEDQHIAAAADSLLIIPPELIHTTEGVGEGRHVLVDIFAPPREDFIAMGWVHNADEYVA